MRIFGFTIIRTTAMNAIHRRNRTLDSVNQSMGDTIASMIRYERKQDEKIEELHTKCSRVNLSALENRANTAELKLKLLKERLERHEKVLPDNELQEHDGKPPGVLSDTLAAAAVNANAGDTAIVLEPQAD